MIVDFHTHLFPDKIATSTIKFLEQKCETKAYTDGTIKDTLTKQMKSGVNLSIVLPVMTKPSQFDSVNLFAIDVNTRDYDKHNQLISFGGIHPLCNDIKNKIKFLKNNGIIGIKIHPDYQDTFIDDDAYYKIISAAADNDMIVVTHAGQDDGYKGKTIRCTPEYIKKLYKKIPYKKIVLAHYGGHRLWQEVLTELSNLNCYFDTSLTFGEIDRELFLKILNRHGEDKVLFASDCPWHNTEKDLKIFNSYGLSKTTYDKILYKNAKKLLEID